MATFTTRLSEEIERHIHEQALEQLNRPSTLLYSGNFRSQSPRRSGALHPEPVAKEPTIIQKASKYIMEWLKK